GCNGAGWIYPQPCASWTALRRERRAPLHNGSANFRAFSPADSAAQMTLSRRGALGGQRLGLRLLPLFASHLLRALKVDERALLVADHDVRQSVAVDVACHHLRSDARIVVDEVRDKVDLMVGAANEFEPIQHGGGVGFDVPFGAMRPESFSGDDIFQ